MTTMMRDIDCLMLAIDELQKENSQLRKRLGDNARTVKRIKQARVDAMQLALWKSAYVHPGRRYAEKVGSMSQRRWQNAIGLLRLARVVVGRRRWATDDLDAIERRMDKATEQALADPQRFFLRLNRHATR